MVIRVKNGSCLCNSSGLGTILAEFVLKHFLNNTQPRLIIPWHMHNAPVVGAYGALKGVEIVYRHSHASLFTTIRVPKAIHGTQTWRRKVALVSIHFQG